ncbi:MAG: RCC1 domain-containing protein [Gemmatimonadales bacterium]
MSSNPPLGPRLALGAICGVLAACSGGEDPATAPEIQSPTTSVSASAAAPAFVQVSGGGAHTCGITDTGQAYCWGNNYEGQLGNGTTGTSQVTPGPVAGSLTFRLISAGETSTCGVTTDHRAYCWGFNNHGQLGDGTTTGRLTPVAVQGDLQFQTIEVSDEHACGLTAGDRRAFCWGSNSTGQLGNGSLSERHTPVAVAGGRAWHQVTLGDLFTCGVTTTGKGYCWGSDREGALGDGSESIDRSRPSPIAGNHVFRQIDAAAFATCAVDTALHAWCWGDNTEGLLGDGTTITRFTPRAVVGGLTFERVTAGLASTCAETTRNQAYCWGDNEQGELGTGAFGQPPFSAKPLPVVGGHGFAQVSVGDGFACARTPEKVTWCWGYNGYGQLGNGTTMGSASPALVIGSN